MDSPQTNQSIYQQLDATISEIRVLTLHQGAQDQELRCSLKTVSLDDQPAFHALSYVWGTGAEKSRISIDGHVVSVTSSMATVLRQFRSHHYDSLQLHSIPLWIDAVCINQADLEERAQQVRLMGKIYRQASRVLLWIGEGDMLSDHAFDRMNDPTFRSSIGELTTTPRALTPDEVKVSFIIGRNLELRRYWTRAWILQELVLATQDPVMLCGSRQILWSCYTQCNKISLAKSYPNLALDWVKSEVPLHEYHDPSCFYSSYFHEMMRDLYRDRGFIPFGLLLMVYIRLAATDPRDHVYGMMGLVSHHGLHLVDVDYEKTPDRVFRDTMAAVWTSGADELLSDIIPGLTFGRADDESDLPSWAPDLSKQVSANPYGDSRLKGQLRPWRAGRRSEIHVEGNILTVKAIKFDSITDTVKMDFDHGWRETFHRGKESGEVNIGALKHIEAMAHKGRKIPIPPSSRLASFSALRDRTPVWNALTDWNEYSPWPSVAGGSKNYEWLPGVPIDGQTLWEILLNRQEIPEAWKMACSPELRNNIPALEAAILSPLLRSLESKVSGKKVFISRFGFLGVGSTPVEVGDVVVLIAGMKCMYVLRPFWDGYRMVGFANVSGLMDWDDLDEAVTAGSLREEDLKIY